MIEIAKIFKGKFSKFGFLTINKVQKLTFLRRILFIIHKVNTAIDNFYVTVQWFYKFTDYLFANFCFCCDHRANILSIESFSVVKEDCLWTVTTFLRSQFFTLSLSFFQCGAIYFDSELTKIQDQQTRV
jgi:hypothetical protein